MNIPKLPDGCAVTPVEAIRVTGPAEFDAAAWEAAEALRAAGWKVSWDTKQDERTAGRFALRAWRREGAC